MIGRSDEQQRLESLLADPGSYAQVIGLPGMGKSTLARAVLPEALWIPLERVQPGGIPAALAAALDVPVVPQALSAAFAEASAVVFDGAEGHVEALSSLLATLRPGAPTRVLITSQTRYPIAAPLELGPLSEEASVQLFEHHASLVSAGLDLSDEADAVLSLVRKFKGWPLALALAASRVRLFSPAEMLLEPPLEVMADARREGRHASLENALERSWALLSQEEQLALARVAQTAAPFCRETFLEITGATLDTLETLLDASLLQWRADGERRRYSLLEPVRAFALGRLPAGDPARDRYPQSILNAARALGPQVTTSDGRAALEALRALQPDLESLVSLGGEPAGQAILALQPLVSALGPSEGSLEQVASLNLEALPHALSQDLRELSIGLLTRVGREHEAYAACESLDDGASKQVSRGEALMRMGRLSEALDVLGPAVDQARDEGRVALMHRGLLAHAAALFSIGDPAACAAKCHEGLAMLDGVDRPDIEGLLQRCLAGAERVLSDRGLEGARFRLERASTLFRKIHHQRYEARTLTGLCIVEAELGLPSAVDRALQTIPFAYRIGEVFSAQRLQMICGLVALETGDFNALDDRLLAIRSPRPPIQAAGVLYRGLAAWMRGERDEGVAGIREGMQAFQDLEMAFDRSLAEHFYAMAVGDPAPSLPDGALVVLRRANALVALNHAGKTIPESLRADCAWSLDLRLLRLMTQSGDVAVVARDGSWFETRTGERVGLGRRRVLRRVLAVFAAHAGNTLTTDTLLRLAWPGETTKGQSGRARVHVAVSELRKLGLREALLSVPVDGGGYTLRARVG